MRAPDALEVGRGRSSSARGLLGPAGRESASARSSSVRARSHVGAETREPVPARCEAASGRRPASPAASAARPSSRSRWTGRAAELRLGSRKPGCRSRNAGPRPSAGSTARSSARPDPANGRNGCGSRCREIGVLDHGPRPLVLPAARQRPTRASSSRPPCPMSSAPARSLEEVARRLGAGRPAGVVHERRGAERRSS